MKHYFVCEMCNAKWFAERELMQCPRCGSLAASTEKKPIPWPNQRRTEMRITRKNYEKARKTVEAAREQMKLVKVWDDAVKRLGDLGRQQLVAITVNDDDGSILTECALASQRPSPATPNVAAMLDPARLSK